ncbi:MAG TPA: class I SAM-dependent methyltransferase [Vicinamibacterales bacterium]|nr:class I SAM-dependent methyltransferase [Vicinamibacterales bacterium]
MSREWDASSYHKVSGPQTAWGQRVLARLDLRGDERVIDAGCGSGRLTGALLDRLPVGRVLAIDRSWNMLQTARANLRPGFGSRVRFAQVALPFMPVRGWADVVFSTATFHWVMDHPALFAGIFTALRPGGRLHAQCGGGPNLAAAHALAEEVMRLDSFRGHFENWPGVWEFASDGETRRRLCAAGFVHVETNLEPAPTTLASEADYREFVTTVIYHPHLARLPVTLKPRFIDEVAARAARQSPPFTLDYWRLNMQAARPAAQP